MDRAIDIYCERVGPGLWAEPLNAVSNLAFIVAGLLLVAALFHTFAVVWAMLADVVPIALFILLYMYLALRRLAALPLWGCWLGVAVVLSLTVVMPLAFGFSVSTYGVALAAMLVVGGFLHFGRRHPAGSRILAAAGIFAVSLALRTADQPLCAALPIGTHYFWHLLNAVVLYNLTRTMMRHGGRAAT